MFPIRVKTVQESDLRMLGSLARNIQRVLPVTQADIDAAAALGKGWVVWKVFEVSDPLDNMRGGTQLIIRQNSVQPGQNVRRVIFVSGPGGQTVVIRGTDYIVLPDAIANSLSYVKAFGGTEQRNLPDNYIQRDYIYIMSGAYLLTDIVPTYDCKIEMDFKTTTVSASKTVLGGRTAVYGGMELIIASSKKFVVDAFGTDSAGRYSSSVTAQNNTRYKFTYDNQVATLESGGSTLFTNTMTGTAANGAALCINGNNDSGTVSGVGEIYLYSFKVWNGQGELVADYVPAVQKGTVPVVGFYDTVSKTFKTATVGTIAAGTETVPTPDAPMDIVSNNGVLKYSANIANVNAQTALVGYYISASGVVTADSYNWIYKEYIPVSPNTTYTLTMSQSVYYVSISEYSTASDSGFVIRKVGSTGANTTLTITTGATTNFVRFGTNLDRTTVTLEEVLAINWQLNKGSSMPYQPYVEGGLYTDGTVETINVHGTNLLDLANCVDGYYYDSNGVYLEASPARLSNFVQVKANETYTVFVYGLKGSANVRVNLFDTNKNWLSQQMAPSTLNQYTAITVTATQDGYLAFSANFVTTGSCIDWSVSQVVRGAYTVATMPEYSPYFDGGTATAEMLLKVGNYQDEQEILSGAVTRKVGIKVLDGTENWLYSSGWSDTTHKCFYAMPLDDIKQQTTSSIECLCSHLEWYSRDGLYADKTIIGGCISGYLPTDPDSGRALTLRVSSGIATDETMFKSWLANQYAAGTPVIVLYPLATPTTESVTGQTLQVTDGNNVVEITQASLTGLELEAEYQAAVQLTIQEVQDANLDNNVTVTIQ